MSALSDIIQSWNGAAKNEINTQGRIELYSNTTKTVNLARTELYPSITRRNISTVPYIIHYLSKSPLVHISEKIKPYTDLVKGLRDMNLERVAKWVFCHSTFTFFSDKEYVSGAFVEFIRLTGFLLKLSHRIQTVKDGIQFTRYGHELSPLIKIIKRVLHLRDKEAEPNILLLNLDIFRLSSKEKVALRATSKKFQQFVDSAG